MKDRGDVKVIKGRLEKYPGHRDIQFLLYLLLIVKRGLVFVRNFVPSAPAFLMNGEPKNFLLKTLHLQGWGKRIDRFKLGEGAMPASFKVLHEPVRKSDTIIADFGESAIGRVAPVDSGFWWIILLRSHTRSTGGLSLAETPECQKGMRLILTLCLSEEFDTFPALLCADGCSMIDRRMLSNRMEQHDLQKSRSLFNS
ncbi:alkaline/neutral invertase CINV2-like [Durio zibethinus]|uniref:Alkaline/neutral invertase n=1 Tax=Durio zibethinus TaxID=66656 RepID=A0A6P5ZMR5_DURZI|nr:alkaline/neutral invertase CINV2-like [Durio zibethinus]